MTEFEYVKAVNLREGDMLHIPGYGEAIGREIRNVMVHESKNGAAYLVTYVYGVGHKYIKQSLAPWRTMKIVRR